MLGEEAEEVRGREGVRIDGGDVVVVSARLGDVGTLDVVGAIAVGVLAGDVDGGVVADEVGVADGGKVVTLDDAVTAAAGLVEGVDGGLVGALVDRLDAVGVVVSHFGVGEFLGEEIDAAVDDAKGVEMNVVVFTRRVQGTVGDSFVLLFEKCGERWTITTSILRFYRQYVFVNNISWQASNIQILSRCLSCCH